MTTSSTRVWVTTASAATDRDSGSASARGSTTRELRTDPLKTSARVAGTSRRASRFADNPTTTMMTGNAMYSTTTSRSEAIRVPTAAIWDLLSFDCPAEPVPTANPLNRDRSQQGNHDQEEERLEERLDLDHRDGVRAGEQQQVDGK